MTRNSSFAVLSMEPEEEHDSVVPQVQESPKKTLLEASGAHEKTMTRQTANFPFPRNLQKVDPLQHFIHRHDICFLEAKSLGIIESFHLHYQSPSNSIRVKSYRCQHLALLRPKVPRFSDITFSGQNS